VVGAGDTSTVAEGVDDGEGGVRLADGAALSGEGTIVGASVGSGEGAVKDEAGPGLAVAGGGDDGPLVG
jgi:hypothetical protein